VRSLSFGMRVLLAATVPAIAIAVVLVWYFTQSRLSDAEQELRERGVAIARQLAPAAEFGVFSANRDILQQLVEAAARETGVVGVSVVDFSGAALAASGKSPSRFWVGSPPRAARLADETDKALVFVAPVLQLHAFFEDVFSDNLEAPPPRSAIGTVLLELSRESLEARKDELLLNAVLITIFGLAVAAIVARLLARGVTSPVMKLADVVSQIKQGRLEARSGVEATGVLRLLETGINDMAESLLEARRDLERRIAAARNCVFARFASSARSFCLCSSPVAAASHDLRQPLQAAGLFVGTLRLRNRDPDLGALIDRVERALGSLEAVLEALLDISRLDAGVVEPRPARIPLAGVFRSLQETFGDPAVQYGAELRFRPTALWCESDPRLLERVLANLVSNALRYCEKGRVLVGCRVRGDTIRVEVRDSGPGVPPERQQEIFREFVQLQTRAPLHDKGLGLGLAIVERLARLLRHPLHVRSHPGRGSTFGITVPRVEPLPAVAESAPAPSAAGLANRRILIVDDDEDVLASLAQFLSRSGAIPMRALSLAEARALIASGAPPDLVISDYRLAAGGDGISAIHALQDLLGPRVPCVILTGDTAPKVLRAVSDAGLPLMSKPVRTDHLLQVLGTMLHAAPEPHAAAEPSDSRAPDVRPR